MLKREDYEKCIKKEFTHNLSGLRLIGIWCTLLSLAFSLVIAVPSIAHVNYGGLFERGLKASGFYLLVTAGFLFFTAFTWHKYNQYKSGKQISNLLIYTLVILSYATIILSGIYLGVWSNPNGHAVIFMVFLVSALSLSSTPPLLNLSLTLIAAIVFAVSTITTKDYEMWIYDIMNLLAIIPIALIFNWHINVYKMSAALNTIMLEEERDNYHDQSTVDELTGLKNRRDFMRKFERYLSSNREKDNFLCLAIMDIDYFKNYNDYYGHPEGDKCLHSVGEALKCFSERTGIYIARIGGEEFAFLWFEEDKSDLTEIISQVHQLIRTLYIPHPSSLAAPYISISIGVHVSKRGTYDSTDNIYHMADLALYEAKEKRNFAIIFDTDGKKHIPGPS